MNKFGYTSLFVLLIVEVFSLCPSGFDELPRGDGCVIAVGRTEFYVDVIRYCALLKAIPVKILNAFDNSYVATSLQLELSSTDAYIGVEKKPGGVWTFADGSPLIYGNWAPSSLLWESNSSICAIINQDTGKWSAAECSFARPFFCSTTQKTEPASTTPTPTSYPRVETTTTRGPSSCSQGWAYNEQTRFCYIAVTGGNLNWTSAETNCQNLGAHLVSIHSADEEQFVGVVFGEQSGFGSCGGGGGNSAWIGLYGTGVIWTGYWTDGTPVDYTLANGNPSSPMPWAMHSWSNAVPPPMCSSHWDWSKADSLQITYICKK